MSPRENKLAQLSGLPGTPSPRKPSLVPLLGHLAFPSRLATGLILCPQLADQEP